MFLLHKVLMQKKKCNKINAGKNKNNQILELQIINYIFCARVPPDSFPPCTTDFLFHPNIINSTFADDVILFPNNEPDMSTSNL